MDNIKFSNNVSVKLATAVLAGDTTITTQTLPSNIAWPVIASPAYFFITIMQIETGIWEICKCTSYIQNADDTWTLTIERAQEGSTAADFTDTAIVENRITAGTLDSMVQAINDQIIITDMISQEELQNIRDVADAIEEIGTVNIQDLVDNANEASETAQSAVDAIQSTVASAEAAQAAAEAAAVTASTMAAQAEDCRDQSCECATESEAAADDAEAASAAAIAANAAAQNALDQFKNLSVGLNVVQIDPTTEIFVNDPLGVDPASIADDVDGLILDIEDGDYALTLSSTTVEVPDPTDPDATITKGTVALYKGTAEPADNYSGRFIGVSVNSLGTSYSMTTTLTNGKSSLPVSYVAWSIPELPTQNVLVDALAIVPLSQATKQLCKYDGLSWTSVMSVYGTDIYIAYADVDVFGTGQGGYAALGPNAWVPVIVDTPANAPTSLQDVVDNFSNTAVTMTAHTLGSGYPEWTYVKNLPIDNLTIFSITKPFDTQGNGFYWFRNTWNRLDYTGAGTVQSVDGIQAGTGHDVQLKYSVTKSEFEALQEAGTLIPGARYLVAEEAQSSSSVDNGVPLFSIITSVMNTVNPGYLSITSDNGVLTQAAFPDAYQQLVNLQTAGEANIVSLDDWNTEFTVNSGICGKFALDTDAQTFRIPCAPGAFWRGASAALGLDVGAYQVDQMRPITGDWGGANGGFDANTPAPTGAFYTGVATNSRAAYGQAGGTRFSLNSSRLGPNYSGDDTHPMSVIVDYQMKMYGAVIDAGTLNISQLVTQKANKAEIQPQLIKAWGAVNAAGMIVSSYGVASVARTAAGTYVITLSSPAPMVDASTPAYAIISNIMRASSANYTIVVNGTSTTFNVYTQTWAGNAIDNAFNFMVIY